MSYFVVTRDAGPAWTGEHGIAEQPGVADHAEFMDGLAADGCVLLAGPLAGTESGRLRALLIVEARHEDEIRDRLADDPWTRSGHLEIKGIESWNVFVGGGRLTAPAASTASTT
jgi:uncharacterized protein YciI